MAEEEQANHSNDQKHLWKVAKIIIIFDKINVINKVNIIIISKVNIIIVNTINIIIITLVIIIFLFVNS